MLSATVQSSPKNLGFLFEGQSLYWLVGCQPQGILKYQASRFRCCKKNMLLKCVHSRRPLLESWAYRFWKRPKSSTPRSLKSWAASWVVSWIHVLQFPCQIGIVFSWDDEANSCRNRVCNVLICLGNHEKRGNSPYRVWTKMMVP